MKPKSYIYRNKDIQKLLDVGSTTASKIIKQLNDELKAKGIYTISGRVPVQYFNERFYIREE